MLLVILAVIAYSVAANEKPWYDLKDAERLFQKFQYDYNRHYEDSEDEEKHFEVFVVNLLKINYLNSNWAVYDINQFADHTIGDTNYLLGYLADKYKMQLTSS
ncbi:unnamed protein product, partial [Iphiclides podalirius]